ncbi:MAG: DUF423 domain-containing protein [Gammaproteobacteria bacterium]|jgi:uncharacterized membrane protein YgdD (TMEM256/DUF423 family)|nr:DUF423 domain-containing protein [Gammaproteobacteria bacterium]
MLRPLAVSGALFALAAIAFGAFGAHAVEGAVTPERLEVWNTAAHYLGWQGTGLLALAALALMADLPQRARRLLRVGGWLLIGGTLVFSGSLFVLVLSGIGLLGAITPFGGVAMLLGWGLAAAALLHLPARD